MIAERDRAVAAIESELDGLRKQETRLQAQARAALDLGLVGTLACELLEAKLAETEREIETVRAQIRRAEARLALARADIPSEQQVAEVCRQLSKGAYYADARGKRELLEALQMKVWVHGEEWWADGIVPGLHLGLVKQ
jgi:multidrug resistance efflux pump